MNLPFQVKLVDQKGLGFDKSGLLLKTQFQELKNYGYKIALRNCLSGTDSAWINDVESALEVGLSIGIYQGYYSPYWADLSEATKRANFAISWANMVDPVRGYEIIQTHCSKYVNNILIDEDQLSADKLNQYPEGMIKA